MQLEPAIRNDLIELIAANFRTDEVNELGRLVLGCFDSNEAAGERHHVSLSPRKCAGLLVHRCDCGGTLASLIKLVVEVDDGVVHGRPVQVEGLEEFLGKLVRTGIHYDFKTRRVITSCRDPQDLPNWGCLKDGREYDITVVSLDIVGNSAKVRKLGTRRIEKLYFTLWSFLREKLVSVDGRIWSWAGDGGIIAFALRDHQARAVRFAIELQSTVPVFNLSASGSPTGDIALRLGIHSGRVKFCIETGTIVSDVINHAAHLEKSSTLPGTVTISRSVYDALPSRVASIFRFGGIFEEKDFFRTIRRLDSLLCEETPDSEERLA
ncbi:MAG: adenylate/guanylate cyclase domain-containing protein [Spirochaetia bacterium]|jgi:class 3 adenylate cyclase